MYQYTTTMTLEEQIGQLVMVGSTGTTVPQELIDLVQYDHVGNVILFSRNILDSQQIHTFTRQLQLAAQTTGQLYPLLIATDQENGMVQRLGDLVTTLPGNMALGATGAPDLACTIARATGLQLKTLGINMNLAPVADVNNNPDNPVIGIRSFGEDPQRVADFVAAAVRGYRQADVVTSLKHFPGHGDTTTDSHLALPTLPHTLERLQHVELLPFVKGITAGADSIMVAHLYLPMLTRQDTLPASVSPAMVQGLLREQLAFDGVVITDCLEMRAIRNTVGTEQGAVMALQAGCDIVLISHHLTQQQASIAAIKAAAQDGRLSRERIQQAAERVMRLKARMLSWNEALASIPGTPLVDVSQLQQQAYERSTTLVKNTAGLIPLSLSPEQRLLIITAQTDVSPVVDDNVASPAAFFVEQVRQRHPATDHICLSHSSTPAEILQKTQEASLILVITANAARDVHQQGLVQRIIQTDRPVIGLAVYNPYDVSAFPQLETYLVTYEYTRPALAAATRVIFGEIPAQGHLPISLPSWQR